MTGQPNNAFEKLFAYGKGRANANGGTGKIEPQLVHGKWQSIAAHLVAAGFSGKIQLPSAALASSDGKGAP